MKTLLKLSALSLVPLLLGACATTAATAVQKPPAPGSLVADEAYVAYVERVALRRGIDVQWVNKPTRRIAKQ